MNRRLSAKRAWARLSERAECGERFGFIACIALLYKAGQLTRAQVVDALNEARITRDDLARFREHSSSSARVQAHWRASSDGSLTVRTERDSTELHQT